MAQSCVFCFFIALSNRSATHKYVASRLAFFGGLFNKLTAECNVLRPEVSQCVYLVQRHFIRENKDPQFYPRWKQSQFMGQKQAVHSPNWPSCAFLKLTSSCFSLHLEPLSEWLHFRDADTDRHIMITINITSSRCAPSPV